MFLFMILASVEVFFVSSFTLEFEKTILKFTCITSETNPQHGFAQFIQVIVVLVWFILLNYILIHEICKTNCL